MPISMRRRVFERVEIRDFSGSSGPFAAFFMAFGCEFSSFEAINGAEDPLNIAVPVKERWENWPSFLKQPDSSSLWT